MGSCQQQLRHVRLLLQLHQLHCTNQEGPANNYNTPDYYHYYNSYIVPTSRVLSTTTTTRQITTTTTPATLYWATRLTWSCQQQLKHVRLLLLLQQLHCTDRRYCANNYDMSDHYYNYNSYTVLTDSVLSATTTHQITTTTATARSSSSSSSSSNNSSSNSSGACN